jgi:chromosome segregation ATPase
MTETNQARDLVATLRDALHQLEGSLGRTRDGIDEIANQAERLRAGVEALGELRQREDTSVGIEMFVDAAVDLLEAFRELESGILDVQAEVDTLEAEMADDEDGREG